MTNAEIQALISKAISELTQTTVGYINKHWKIPPPGTHWADGMNYLAQASSALNAVEPAPIPTPTPTVGQLPKYGVCPGHASQTWDNSLHTWVMDKMKELAQGQPFGWRIDAGGMSTRLDRDVNACLARGITPYLIVGGTNRNPSRSAPTWVRDMATHYKGKGIVYTGPNEPDLNGWDAITLAWHCKAVYDTIKAVDPDAPVGYAALWKGSPNSFDNWQPYVKQAAAICKGHMDFFPSHFYDDPGAATVANSNWNIWTWYFDKFGAHPGQTAEAIFRNAGINIPFVNDESGGKETDPEFTNKCLRLFNQAKQNVCYTSFIYCILPDVPGYNYLLNANRTERPSYQPLKNFMATV
jgi:hypothetical protein